MAIFGSVSAQLGKIRLSDGVLLGVLVVLLVFPLKPPQLLQPVLDSPFFLIALFLGVIYLFLHHHPLLGILAVFAVYEFLRGNQAMVPAALGGGGGGGSPPTPSSSRASPAGTPVDAVDGFSGGGGGGSLEEELVGQMAPLNASPATPNDPSLSFQPLVTEQHGAFSLRS